MRRALDKYYTPLALFQFILDECAYPIHIMPRVSFTGDGKTDSSTCAWMVWDQRTGRQKIDIVPRSTLLDRG